MEQETKEVILSVLTNKLWEVQAREFEWSKIANWQMEAQYAREYIVNLNKAINSIKELK